jgi:hypothetical protein
MKKAENQNTCNLELSKTGRVTNRSLILTMNDLQKSRIQKNSVTELTKWAIFTILFPV